MIDVQGLDGVRELAEACCDTVANQKNLLLSQSY
jgi:hypothetical protein